MIIDQGFEIESVRYMLVFEPMVPNPMVPNPKLNKEVDTIDHFVKEDVHLVGYYSHEAIKLKMDV